MERQLPTNLPKGEPKSAGSRTMIPELVQHIISHIDPPPDRQQYKKLMLVSRLFFNCVVPVLWKHVPNPETLLALIPALTIKREAVDRQNRAGVIVRNGRVAVFQHLMLNHTVLKRRLDFLALLISLGLNSMLDTYNR